jgi:hypothetical protein
MFKMYSGVHDDEYRLMDSLCEEQYLIGGVTAWIYAYQGPRSANETNLTKPDYNTLGSKITDIGNMVLMESPSRKYSIDAISLPVVYQVQDANMDMQIPGLFMFDTMDITLPYNLMINTLGRKIITGDVIELANLRDSDLLDPDATPINRFFVVHDAFKSASGYSHTWFHHIWKLRVVPLTDSPEFRDILGTGANSDDLSNYLSTQQRELKIMDLIVQQADSEVPFIHYDNEQIHTSTSLPSINTVFKSFNYPTKPSDGMFMIKKTMPELYESSITNSIISWNKLTVLASVDYPEKPNDCDFFWLINEQSGVLEGLKQYNLKKSTWETVTIDTGFELPTNDTETSYFILETLDTAILVYNSTTQTWDIARDDIVNPYVDNKNNIQDSREVIPDMNNVLKGISFPLNPTDGEWFLRTDLVPNVLWKFENNAWRKFNYGGRVQWTGTDYYRSTFINNRGTYTDGINTFSSRQSSAGTPGSN